ncbi:DUF4468 domain-containing protein [Hymenobacter terricola]|uniref:DUF4468 domain-containing protein n=1 Tax=Hymenobacter terricola TaxID=2819236 RepID=UPI001B30BF80|nr:DUF4468 domain-containing protein [Hymenobacter terricola]
MKLTWLLLLLVLPGGTAAAQGTGTAPAKKDPELMVPYYGHFTITGQYVPLYLTADTTAVDQHASRGEVLPVWQIGNIWAQVHKAGKSYYVRRSYLNFPDALVITPDSVAVPRDPATGLIRYVGDVDVPGTQAELMGRAQVWFATGFPTKDVLQVNDAATATLVGRTYSEIFIHAPEPNNHRVDYTIQLTCRDGHYHYAISNFAFGAYLAPIGNGTGSPAELFVFRTKANGQQRALMLKHKAELCRVGRELQSQLRTALSRPTGS